MPARVLALLFALPVGLVAQGSSHAQWFALRHGFELKAGCSYDIALDELDQPESRT